MVTAVVLVALRAGPATPQHGDKAPPAASKASPPPGQPIRTTADAVHAAGGTPPGWRLTIPAGSATEGRDVFVKLECFKCHEVREDYFPPPTPEEAGPPLTGMGQLHPAEYLAESIFYPNRVILEGPGFAGSDGLSKMPSYNEVLTVQELIDLVAYLRTLTGGGGHSGH